MAIDSPTPYILITDSDTPVNEGGFTTYTLRINNYDPNTSYTVTYQGTSSEFGSNFDFDALSYTFSSEELTAANGAPVTQQIQVITGDDGVTGNKDVTFTFFLEDDGNPGNFDDTLDVTFTVEDEPVPTPDPSFTVSYGSQTVNDGDVVAAGDGITITGENLAPGQDYLLGFYLDFNGDGNYSPGELDTPDGKKSVITLTSDNPTFTESEYSFGEITDSLQSREISFYFQLVEEVDNGNPNLPLYQPVSEQFAGAGLNETQPITFTIVNDEYVAPVSSGGGGSSSPAPVTVAPEPVIVDDVGNTDNVSGGEGNDIVRGLGGNDVINGNGGDDFLNGNVGDDIVRGGAGNDQVFGGMGNDVVNGNQGFDFVRGGMGDDTVYGGSDDDIVNGNQGADTVYGNFGNDVLRGGMDDDIIYGGVGNDQLYGDKGNDQLVGGDGADTFVAGEGNDIIQDYEAGVDTLSLAGVSNVSTVESQLGTTFNYDGGSILVVGMNENQIITI